MARRYSVIEFANLEAAGTGVGTDTIDTRRTTRSVLFLCNVRPGQYSSWAVSLL